MATGVDYCALQSVLATLYAGRGMNPGDPAPADASRDTLLAGLITDTSRDFDHEVAGPHFPGLFAPKYEVRYFSGRGDQVLKIDPLLVVTKVRLNTTPGNVPTWQDITGELTTYKMGLLPVGGPGGSVYPKHSIFRQASWYVDPFPLGNVEITGIWGVCLPDPKLAEPGAPWSGLTPQSVIDALTPTGAAGGGWWATPDDVSRAVSNWVVFRFEEGKTTFSQHPASAQVTGSQSLNYPSTIPTDVQRVITRYRVEDSDVLKMAMVANDRDVEFPAPYRWRDWITIQ